MRKERLCRHSFPAARCGGLTLIEVLISLVVTSMGLLGIAALQMRTLQNNYSALMRSHASALSADIADRMRANRDAVRMASGTSPYEVKFGSKPEAGTDPTQALLDLVQWKNALTARLPSGDGAISVDEGTGLTRISVRWGERSETDNSSTDNSSDTSSGASMLLFVTETVI